MKKILESIVIILLVIGTLAFCGAFFSGCKSKTIYVPVEKIKTEYKDRIHRDSIHLLDSVMINRFVKGDTVFMTKEKYKYLYRDKMVRDSIIITDSIQVPYPVKGETEYVNYLHWWQNLLMAMGGILAGIMLCKVYVWIRKILGK